MAMLNNQMVIMYVYIYIWYVYTHMHQTNQIKKHHIT